MRLVAGLFTLLLFAAVVAFIIGLLFFGKGIALG